MNTDEVNVTPPEGSIPLNRRVFCALTALSAVALSCRTRQSSGLSTPTDQQATIRTTFDFVVVGSGAGGGPLAVNLAQAGFTVALLEAGGWDNSAEAGKVSNTPVLHALASENPELSWSYFVEHYSSEKRATFDDPKRVTSTDPQKTGVLYPRGATVGGSTAVNALITLYPEDHDWHMLQEELNDPSWGPIEMRRHYLSIEDPRYGAKLTRRNVGEFLTGTPFSKWLSLEVPDIRLLQADRIIKDTVFNALRVAHQTHRLTAADPLGKNPLDIGALIAGNLMLDPNTEAVAREHVEGVFLTPMNTRNGRRHGVRAYIEEGMARTSGRLQVFENTLVTRILLEQVDGQVTARGVETRQGSHLYKADPLNAEGDAALAMRFQNLPAVTFQAKKEVIVCAGAFNTPQILMLSGIGDPAELERHGIETIVASPALGTNLQDRYEVGVSFEFDEAFGSLSSCRFGERNDPCQEAYERETTPLGKGFYATNGVTVAFKLKSRKPEDSSRPEVRSAEKKDVPDLYVFGVPSQFNGYEPGYSKKINDSRRVFTWVILKGHTLNRTGTVKLRSANPYDTPIIDFNYFPEGTDDDAESIADAIEFVRSLMKRADGTPLAREQVPGPQVQTRADLVQFIKSHAWGHHASCTCPMGPAGTPEGVLDPAFAVKGLKGLRVVDASIFPRIPGLFIACPIYMAGQKASETIIEAARRGGGSPG